MCRITAVSSFFTFPNENGEPIHIHVSRVGNHNRNLKYWLVNDKWVLDKKQSSLTVSIPEYNKIAKYLMYNSDKIIRRLHAFHAQNGNSERCTLIKGVEECCVLSEEITEKHKKIKL